MAFAVLGGVENEAAQVNEDDEESEELIKKRTKSRH